MAKKVAKKGKTLRQRVKKAIAEVKKGFLGSSKPAKKVKAKSRKAAVKRTAARKKTAKRS